ncbi:MAG: LytTR family DNA-binding domain-containing protein [Bacteroidota bacterium]
MKKLTKTDSYPKIALHAIDGWLFVHAEEILYAIADGNYTRIHLTNNRSVRVLKKLKAVSECLSTMHFIRIHRSHLINLKHIQAYTETETVTMSNGRCLAVARHRKATFLEKFTHI